MAIITIARQEGSLSKEISEGLAQRFGWQFISRDLINKELAGSWGGRTQRKMWTMSLRSFLR